MGRTSEATRNATDMGVGTVEMVQVSTLDIKNVQSILLADGWHNVKDCEIVSGFGLGESHSPLGISQFFDKALRYTNRYGNPTWTPLSNVLSYSTGTIDSSQEQPYSGQGSFSRG